MLLLYEEGLPDTVPFGAVVVGLLWFVGLVTVVLCDVLPDDVVTVLSAGRAPGAVRVTVDFPAVGLDVTVAGFFDTAVCFSRIADEVLVMLLFPKTGLEVTVPLDADAVTVLFTGRLLTVPPPLREDVPAKTLSEPVLCRVPLYTRGLWSLSG